jgi:hypothetical protein
LILSTTPHFTRPLMMFPYTSLTVLTLALLRTTLATIIAVTVDPSNSTGAPLSPNVFGANGPMGLITVDPLAPYPLYRWGGNAATRYNAFYDVSTRADDWYFLNEPGNSNTDLIWLTSVAQANASGLVTITTIGFLACSGGVWGPACATKAAGFSQEKYGAQQKNECSGFTPTPTWCDADAGNGVLQSGVNVVGNNPADTSVPAPNASYALAWLDRLAESPSWPHLKGVLLDNEMMLWSKTHRDVHPNATTYDEAWESIVTFAAPIRAKYPHLEVHGPQSWGWCAYFNSAVQDANSCVEGDDRRAHGDTPFIQWLITQLVAYEAAHGVLLITHLDVHAYPAGNGVEGSSEDEVTGRLRVLAPMMWSNTTYTDGSWITDPVMLLPRLRGWITSAGGDSLGLKLAISEYAFGADTLVTAGVATAETLAILSAEGVDEAAVWTAPAPGTPKAAAFTLFLGAYAGARGAVVGVPVSTLSEAPADIGAFAFRDDAGMLRLLITGKAAPSAGATAVTLSIAWPSGTPRGVATAQVFGFSHATPTLSRLTDVLIPCGDNSTPVSLSIGAWSAELLVVDVTSVGCIAGVGGLLPVATPLAATGHQLSHWRALGHPVDAKQQEWG